MNSEAHIPKKLEGISPIIREMRADGAMNWQMLSKRHLQSII